jgi:D-glycero-D-manno-heptose 1,7-bisphosphate phosphatase
MSQKVVLIMGYPGSGKTTLADKFSGYERLNRDTEGGTIANLLPKFALLLATKKSVVMDNLFPSAESRKPFIQAAQKAGIPIECEWMDTSIEDSQINVLHRMWKNHGRMFMSPEDISHGPADPGLFPIAVLFKYRKDFQPPSTTEGFAKVNKVHFVRQWDSAYKNKALLLDYDDTLRITLSGDYKFPSHACEIDILPGRREVLKDYEANKWFLLGCSNQSGISRKQVSESAVKSCFEYTNKQLGVYIDYRYCPHNVPPNCYCRKPQSGMAMELIEEYLLDPKKCIFVGDQTTDKTFAERVGFTYADQKDFFKLED